MKGQADTTFSGIHLSIFYSFAACLGMEGEHTVAAKERSWRAEVSGQAVGWHINGSGERTQRRGSGGRGQPGSLGASIGSVRNTARYKPTRNSIAEPTIHTQVTRHVTSCSRLCMTAHDWVHVCLFIDTLLSFSLSLSVSHPRFFLAPAACGQIDEGRSLCDARPSMRPRGRGEADPPGDAGVAGTIVFFLTCLPASQPAASACVFASF